ncbi:MAG: CDP-archaeol synthase [Candidatus Micrarchaeota archaeon]|nr:CDP-archaeol synthase [Candidatus Micrarchaeota archaeon]
MESLISDLLLVLPLHLTNDLVFLIMRWQMLGKLHEKDRPVSKAFFGKSRTFMGMALIFSLNLAFYAAFTGKILPLPAAGAMIGVHASSLLKRSLRMKEGQPLPPVDQLDFVLGGIAGLALSGIHLQNLYLVLAISFAAHLASNIAAYLLGLKEVWW